MWGFKGPRQGGFTLLELLVVMAVSGLVFSLAAPPLMDIYERTRARAELVAARETLAEIGLLAFVQGRAARLVLEGREMRMYWVREQGGEAAPGQDVPDWRRGFERLFFPPAVLTFTPMGYPNQLEVVVRVGEREERLSLDTPALPHRGESP